MPEGTYNSFRKSGQVVDDPRHIVRLEGDNEWLGGDMRGVGVEEAVGYLLMRMHGVTIGDQSDYYKENGRPDVIVKIDRDGGTETKKFEWDSGEEDYVLA